MTKSDSTSHYAFGSTNAEHERLIRQGARLNPLTERLFREAGVGTGQRVLDLGSGVGDVAMLAAKLVGPSGEVIGIERDARSVDRARARAAEAGVRNVTFRLADVSNIPSDQAFDVVVGRLILEFVPDPVAVLRSLSRVVRPGGAFVFHEVSHLPFLALTSHLPLWSATAALFTQVLRSAGANIEMGLALYQIFLEAGLPAPRMHMEIMLGHDPDFTRWIYDVFCSLRPQIYSLNLHLEALGDLDTLLERLQAEAAASKTIIPYTALVGAWSHKPVDERSKIRPRRGRPSFLQASEGRTAEGWFR